MNKESPQKKNDGTSARFTSDIFTLVSGTAIAQIIMAVSSPAITRLFSPEVFGIYALFSSITSILASILCLKYEAAIVLPEDEKNAANLLAGSLGVAGLVSLFTIPLVWLTGESLSNWLHAPEIAPYLWWIPIVLFFGGIGAGHPALNMWATRKKQFAGISYSRISGALATILIQLAFGFFGVKSGGGLITGALAGSIFSAILLAFFIWRQSQTLLSNSIHWALIWQNLKEYKKTSFYNTFAILLNTISWQIPSLLLSYFFSPTIVGYYAMGTFVLRAPMDLIGSTIGQVFHSHSAISHRDGTLAGFVESTFRQLVEYSFFPILILAVVGREIFSVVFGTQWAEAGVYTQILSIWMCFWFISSPLSRLYIILDRNEYALNINIAVLVSRIASLWLGGILNSPRLAIWLFSISGAIVYGVLAISIIVLAGVSWNAVGKILLRNVAIFLPVGSILLLLKIFAIPDLIQVIVSVFLTALYFLYRFKKLNFLKQSG
jgi:O-antigen/teichoic acid export membrane protein